MSVDLLEKCFASTRAVLANVAKEQLDEPAPTCKSWKVRDLINHIVGGAEWFAVSVETGVGPGLDEADTTERRDLADGDFVATFDENTARALAAFRSPGAMDRVLKLPFAEMPGSAFVLLASCDTFTHGWDLSRAVGGDVDRSLAGPLLGFAKAAIPPQFRGDEGKAPFTAEVAAPEGADETDQLMAWLGRTP